ncbi:DUF4105 domain-containing protein [Sulfurimonas sp.]|uniref:Lnb N-terminal periplasmic domain-containing protein n=1 Tax=Sulfurimonas sp. TaxID=2022749 RepID=UPI00356498DA
MFPSFTWEHTGTTIFTKLVFIALLTNISLFASSQFYKEKAQELNLSDSRYWHILLHFENGKSEIEDENFFLSKDGFKNPSAELNATIDALFNETKFDDNSTACSFPARKDWLSKQLGLPKLADVKCEQFDIIMEKLQPESATLVFPAAHINSPASMFGHTFLRVNSKYNSKLLSYAVNYAANADPTKENGFMFAIKGLFGGYYGKYSLLPYYDKLKEYRDTEQRDVWEYDLNLTKEETIKMLKHIWELKDTHSAYYFFTQNCSYNMLWFIEAAREDIHLREYFYYEVIPLETVHAAKLENIISNKSYRPSKRTKLLKYEDLIKDEYIPYVQKIIDNPEDMSSITEDKTISIEQKQYVLEAAIELMEYQYKRNSMDKETYLKKFHQISSVRSTLGLGNALEYKTPPNPINGHRAFRVQAGAGVREGKSIGFLGIRPAYHDINDIGIGYLRGTQIEFLNFELSYIKDGKLGLENATLISLLSLAQRSNFFNNISLRVKLGFDKNYLYNTKTNFIITGGAGFSWGNDLGYMYILADPLAYVGKESKIGIGVSLGIVIDQMQWMSSSIELTQRLYDDEEDQKLINISQNIAIDQNIELRFVYDYKDKNINNVSYKEETFKSLLNFYF